MEETIHCPVPHLHPSAAASRELTSAQHARLVRWVWGEGVGVSMTPMCSQRPSEGVRLACPRQPASTGLAPWWVGLACWPSWGWRQGLRQAVGEDSCHVPCPARPAALVAGEAGAELCLPTEGDTGSQCSGPQRTAGPAAVGRGRCRQGRAKQGPLLKEGCKELNLISPDLALHMGRAPMRGIRNRWGAPGGSPGMLHAPRYHVLLVPQRCSSSVLPPFSQWDMRPCGSTDPRIRETEAMSDLLESLMAPAAVQR